MWMVYGRHLVCVAGIALRVPTPNVSVVDLVIQTEKKTFAEEVSASLSGFLSSQHCLLHYGAFPLAAYLTPHNVQRLCSCCRL